MTKRLLPTAAAMLLVAFCSVPMVASAADLPNSLQLGQSNLVLNGSGVRRSTLLSLYASGLYLPTKTNDATSIIAADAPMAITIKITSKFVSQKKMVAALDSGFKNSTNGQTAAITNQINQFKSCFTDSITIGDTFTIAYQPTSGVVVTKNGIQKGVIKSLAFKQALFGIWLGQNPADHGLKNGLLGE
jgi:hypothetical protein